MAPKRSAAARTLDLFDTARMHAMVKPMSDLEDKFREAAAAAKIEIDAAMKEASDALDRAVAASCKYGIPFYAYQSGVGQVYKPGSFEAQWGDVDQDVRDDVLEDGEGEYEGWQASAICF